jgi:uncharacterized iron-regulated membrane protein
MAQLPPMNGSRRDTPPHAGPNVGPGHTNPNVLSGWWQRWVRQPQTLWLRRAVFQIHLWAGLGAGLYIFMISLTGSLLVYRNELYLAFSPRPVVVHGDGDALSADALAAAARRAYPGHEVTNVQAGETPNHAVEVTLSHGDDSRRRLFHPYTAEDLGDPLPLGYRVTAWLLDLHDNLLGGRTGRRINGIGALLLLLLCATGAVIWWPGIRSWRRSLTVNRRSTRLTWRLHSAFGFWAFAFLLMWALTGTYLANPDVVSAVMDYLEPFDENNPSERVVDRIQYWLGYLHFGRLGGRGIPGCGRGWCDSMAKLIWAVAALVPPVMFVTGALMWWWRVVRPVRRAQGVAVQPLAES